MRAEVNDSRRVMKILEWQPFQVPILDMECLTHVAGTCRVGATVELAGRRSREQHAGSWCHAHCERKLIAACDPAGRMDDVGVTWSARRKLGLERALHLQRSLVRAVRQNRALSSALEPQLEVSLPGILDAA